MMETITINKKTETGKAIYKELEFVVRATDKKSNYFYAHSILVEKDENNTIFVANDGKRLHKSMIHTSLVPVYISPGIYNFKKSNGEFYMEKREDIQYPNYKRVEFTPDNDTFIGDFFIPSFKKDSTEFTNIYCTIINRINYDKTMNISFFMDIPENQYEIHYYGEFPQKLLFIDNENKFIKREILSALMEVRGI